MNFVRASIPALSTEKLRQAGATSGWLLESNEVLKVGFGPVVEQIVLEGGLDGHFEITDALRKHTLTGEAGPNGTGIVAFGSLPFDRSARAVLEIPTFCISLFSDGNAWLTRSESAFDWPKYFSSTEIAEQPRQISSSLTFAPTAEDYEENVQVAVDILQRGEIEKVVLARSISGSVPVPISHATLATRLRAKEPNCTLYAMPTGDGRRYIGVSPELLLRRTSNQLQCHPLAGTISLVKDDETNEDFEWLLSSAKNRAEHAIPVQEILSALENLYELVSADETPSIVELSTLAHLGTWINASCEHVVDAPDAIEVLARLHPTSAVCGIPRADAYRLIKDLEKVDRGHFAGPVGWIDHTGDGEWWVAIRGIVIEENEFEAWAGAGIVSDSEPSSERKETRNKLAVAVSTVVTDSFQ